MSMAHNNYSGALVLLSMLMMGCGGGGDDAGDAAPPRAAADPGSGPATTAASTTVVAAGATSYPVLNQAGNPVYSEIARYTSWLSKDSDPAAALAADKLKADNIVSWQMSHGGFYKLPAWYAARWNGTAPRSEWFGANKVELGTIDNDGTVTEIMFLANVFGRTGNVAYRDSARRAVDFLLGMQAASGGFPQVYPARTGTSYSNHITFNDNAMVRALVLLDHGAQQKAPLAGDFLTATQRTAMKKAVERAVGYILKAQIVQNGVKTVWCAQHDPVNFAPLGARSYELPSKSGKESAQIVAFLLTRPQSPAVVNSVKAAIAWYKSAAVQLKDTAYEKTNSKATGTSPFIYKAGSATWYRFYDLTADTGFFSGRLPTDNPPGTGKQYDIMNVEAERRYGYEWGGNYGTTLFNYASKVGY